MRLTAIKLAGFKSFVDPTTFTAPSNLTGIVGPNGCGKSNIIDAVRWVMGEGSAKVLRGESMADVIFSGSSTRKPVGTATVELIFDNSEGRITGEFAGYNEISVKRQVGRDGISHYSLNGTRCRRKDIRDLFLGTGLGSKSYSVIEQGMISQVVDAGPDDIRAHLEEAAGISRYKERRRETERRIKHTRENLDRLSDLREEIASHLARLKRQARAAERYKKLKIEQREQQSMLLALQWSKLQEKAEVGRADLAKQETAMQAQLAEQRAAEARMETIHQQQAGASEAFNTVQGEMYAIGSDIARLEQTIQHTRELQERRATEHEEISRSMQDMEQHMVLDRAQVEDLTLKLAEVEPALQKAKQSEADADTKLQSAESQVQDWQERLQAHHLRSNEMKAQADGLGSVIDMLDRRMQDGGKRLESLSSEVQGTDTVALSDQLRELTEQARGVAKQLESEQEQLEHKRAELEQRRRQLRDSTNRQHELQGDINRREGRLESLRALQQAASEAGGEVAWLESAGLSSARRLVDQMEVSQGWETAVETVLAFWLDAVLVDDQPAFETATSRLGAGDDKDFQVTLLKGQTGKVLAATGSLAEKVTAPDVIMDRLNRVQVVDNLDSALRAAAIAGTDISVITRQGHWLGQSWIRVSGDQAGKAGMLARKQEINTLETEVAELRERWSRKRKENDAGRDALPGLERDIDGLQQRVNGLHRQAAELESRTTASRERIVDLDSRQRQIAEETASVQQQRDEDQQEIGRSRAALGVLLEQMAEAENTRADLEKQRQALLERRDAARVAARETRNHRHELALTTGSRRASLDSLRQSLQRMDSQFSQLQKRYLDLSEQIAASEDPEQKHRAEMDALLQRRVSVEATLGESRQRLQQLEEDYRKQDAERQTAVRTLEGIREALERARLKQQEVELNARSLQRQVAQMDQDVAELAANLPEDADPERWQAALEKLAVRITRLEPVNLAAISEYDEELKRKEYMDAQHEDLMNALETLEKAIRKIDRKTRTRFKDTFENINKGIQDLFPRLFGGGHAYLEMTGEDLLTTGVQIMARPPGKRVSSINLLSGGEKALTAVAFVFAIFRLNPAPFCLLDEVDAPLDDANVQRFTTLVREMSGAVQFVVVTHNKITMETVHQLSGVTMREPGVSRLVQVDIDEAARIVAD